MERPVLIGYKKIKYQAIFTFIYLDILYDTYIHTFFELVCRVSQVTGIIKGTHLTFDNDILVYMYLEKEVLYLVINIYR